MGFIDQLITMVYDTTFQYLGLWVYGLWFIIPITMVNIPWFIVLIEGSLEVKLPTIWTVEKQR